jgi:hypothetical protein
MGDFAKPEAMVEHAISQAIAGDRALLKDCENILECANIEPRTVRCGRRQAIIPELLVAATLAALTKLGQASLKIPGRVSTSIVTELNRYVSNGAKDEDGEEVVERNKIPHDCSIFFTPRITICLTSIVETYLNMPDPASLKGAYVKRWDKLSLLEK